MEIINAIYCTEWDDGFILKQACKINTKTKEVFDIKYDFETLNTLENLQGEWVIVNGVKHKLCPKDELPYWYSEN